MSETGYTDQQIEAAVEAQTQTTVRRQRGPLGERLQPRAFRDVREALVSSWALEPQNFYDLAAVGARRARRATELLHRQVLDLSVVAGALVRRLPVDTAAADPNA